MKYTPPRPFKKVPGDFSPKAQKLFEAAVWRGEQLMLQALRPNSMKTSRQWLTSMADMLNTIARSAKMKRMFYDFVLDAMGSSRPCSATLKSAQSLLWLNLYAEQKKTRAPKKGAKRS